MFNAQAIDLLPLYARSIVNFMERINLVHQTIPERLQVIAQPPACLNVLSANWENLLARPAVAIVGSRRPSSYGQHVTRRLARELASQGIVIVSGLANGIDSEAHRGALEAGGLTIAVLPAGVEQVYPATNRALARRIVDQGGALISEYDDISPHPFKFQFVERNRLIAGMASVVIVTEASLTSGSRHTVDFALDQGKTVMAVPGRISDELAGMPHKLLFDGAHIIRDTNDVLQQLGLSGEPRNTTSADPAEQVILSLLALGNRSEPQLRQQCQLDITVFNQKVTMLEISGRICSDGAGGWQLA